ncbi:MAG: hypothetical protein WKF58_02835 [Ilumatobacteraceae bacterium]
MSPNAAAIRLHRSKQRLRRQLDRRRLVRTPDNQQLDIRRTDPWDDNLRQLLARDRSRCPRMWLSTTPSSSRARTLLEEIMSTPISTTKAAKDAGPGAHEDGQATCSDADRRRRRTLAIAAVAVVVLVVGDDGAPASRQTLPDRGPGHNDLVVSADST